MSGGKGGSTTSTVTIPEYIEAAAQRNLNKAERISQIGYTPYYGPDVAAFTPMQQAGFQNIADTAGAFGMAAPTSQQDIMGGMGPATTYAGGVQGYSSAPIYEQSLATLGQQRPGQKAYIDSFFIDPYSGGGSYGNFAPIDYTSYGTMADQAAANRANDLAIAQAGQVPSSTITQEETMRLGDVVAPGSGYNPVTDILTDEQRAYVSDPANVDARIAQEDLAMSITGDANSNIIDAGKGLFNVEPSFDSPSSAGSYGGSLVTGGLSGDFTPIPGIAGNIADNIVASVSPEYAIEQQGQNFAESGGSTYDPNKVITNKITGGTSTGGYNFNPNAFSSDYGSANFEFSDPVFPKTAALYDGPAVASDMPDTSMTAIPGYTTPAVQAIDDLKVPGTSTLSVNKSDTPAVGAVSDDGNWQQVVNPGTNAITRQWVGDSSSSSNDSGGGGSSSDSGGTVLCTAYASMGYLPADIWSLDTRYGIKRFRQDPVMVSGYRLWASPIAKFIKTDTLAAKAVRAALWPMVRVWAEEMAYQMKPEKYSGNKFGKLVMAMGEPFSYAVGATLLKRNVQKEL
jgi:hypothetical protein